MCPADVRLVVIKPSKPYRSVFTTDLTLEIPKIVENRQRWQIETAFRDAKQHFGFSVLSGDKLAHQSLSSFVQRL